MDFNIKDNNKDNYLCKNLFNDSFDIPKEKSLFCDIKDTKLNSTYSFQKWNILPRGRKK